MTDRDGPERAREDADDDAPAEDDASAPEDAEAVDPDDAPAVAEKKKTKKKRRKTRGDEDAKPALTDTKGPTKKKEPKPLPGPGTPDGTRLREAHRAFDAGDYREVRRLCRALEASDVPGVGDAARALYRRTTVDPAQGVVMAACAAVLAAIVWVWIL